MFSFQCCSLTCPLSCKVVVVGTASGHLYMISFLKMSSPKVLEKRLMHDGPVKVIRYVSSHPHVIKTLLFNERLPCLLFRSDQAGVFLISASTEGPVFFYSSLPSTKFDVLGYVGMSNPHCSVAVSNNVPRKIFKIAQTRR